MDRMKTHPVNPVHPVKKPWPTVRLGEVLIEQKQRIGSFDAGELPLLGVSNQNGLQRSGMPRISDMSRYLRVEKDWFAYNPMRINVGSIGWAQTAEQSGVISPDYVVFSCSERILPRLLFSFLKHRRGLQAINEATAGSVRERLYFQKLAQLQFSLPPLAEQQRIVARIEELATHIAEARILRQQAAEEAKALTSTRARSVLSRVTDRTTRLAEWLHPNRDGIQTGPFGAQLSNTDFTESGIPLLTIGNIQYSGLDSNRLKFVSPVKAEQLARFRVREGDLLFARMGTVGRCCVVPTQAEGWLINYHIIRVAMDTTRVDPRFIHWTIQSSADIETYLDDKIQGSTRKGVNSKIVAALPCRVPPLPLQRQIVAELDALQAQVDALKRLQADSAAELDALLPAILDRAFRGDL